MWAREPYRWACGLIMCTLVLMSGCAALLLTEEVVQMVAQCDTGIATVVEHAVMRLLEDNQDHRATIAATAQAAQHRADTSVSVTLASLTEALQQALPDGAHAAEEQGVIELFLALATEETKAALALQQEKRPQGVCVTTADLLQWIIAAAGR